MLVQVPTTHKDRTPQQMKVRQISSLRFFILFLDRPCFIVKDCYECFFPQMFHFLPWLRFCVSFVTRRWRETCSFFLPILKKKNPIATSCNSLHLKKNINFSSTPEPKDLSRHLDKKVRGALNKQKKTRNNTTNPAMTQQGPDNAALNTAIVEEDKKEEKNSKYYYNANPVPLKDAPAEHSQAETAGDAEMTAYLQKEFGEKLNKVPQDAIVRFVRGYAHETDRKKATVERLGYYLVRYLFFIYVYNVMYDVSLKNEKKSNHKGHNDNKKKIMLRFRSALRNITLTQC
ncbi:hypothetical protein RFI_30105 [Reticulomyxa filosa]|uniref:Uncharacterized protein n=1 Tax=Reticulomyxa filosa TaxID=46433 RepID=X6M102_RETFI|nr:hypothetical protein RFI_30105 [Reticulomyxa filosa]|eukprot:ETO07286.1 hypothetical protein RFI_30105 [Reticulomyxa filosa]